MKELKKQKQKSLLYASDLSDFRLEKMTASFPSAERTRRVKKEFEKEIRSCFIKNLTLLFGKEIPKDERKGLYFLKASAEQGNIYAAAILENRAELQKAIAVSSVIRIFAYIANLFEKKQRKDKGRNRMILERKKRRKIQDKKMAQGLRE